MTSEMSNAHRIKWAYDPDSRTVYDVASGDAICIVSDLANVDKMHAIGETITRIPRMIAAMEEARMTLELVNGYFETMEELDK